MHVICSFRQISTLASRALLLDALSLLVQVLVHRSRQSMVGDQLRLDLLDRLKDQAAWN